MVCLPVIRGNASSSSIFDFLVARRMVLLLPSAKAIIHSTQTQNQWGQSAVAGTSELLVKANLSRVCCNTSKRNSRSAVSHSRILTMVTSDVSRQTPESVSSSSCLCSAVMILSKSFCEFRAEQG